MVPSQVNSSFALAADAPTTPDIATLHAVANHLEHTIASGEPEQAKALLAILIAELRVNSRAEVLPTYRLGTPTVCAPTSSMDVRERQLNLARAWAVLGFRGLLAGLGLAEGGLPGG